MFVESLQTDFMELPEGRYRLLHLLGRGGMAQVWAAHDTTSGRDVAIKATADGTDESAQWRLRQEASIIASIDHPGVVGVHQIGGSQHKAYFVMDLLPGADLAAVLRDGPLPPRTALRLAAGVAEALRAVHDRGVVHGDVKPSNVMVHQDRATLIDFGIASSIRKGAEHPAFGTTSYMAPEQIRVAPVSAAADVYTLGCLSFAALTGRAMFPETSPEAMMHHHAHAAPPRLSDLAPAVPAKLDALIGAMLAKDPAERPTATQVRDDLTALLSGAAIRLQSGPLAVTQDAEPPSPDPEGTRPMLAALPEAA